MSTLQCVCVSCRARVHIDAMAHQNIEMAKYLQLGHESDLDTSPKTLGWEAVKMAHNRTPRLSQSSSVRQISVLMHTLSSLRAVTPNEYTMNSSVVWNRTPLRTASNSDCILARRAPVLRPPYYLPPPSLPTRAQQQHRWGRCCRQQSLVARRRGVRSALPSGARNNGGPP